MQLSDHFSLSELTVTNTGLPNDPSPEIREALRETAQFMEGVRDFLGHPIHVNSGYRSPAVNRAIGGSKTSAHMLGYAVDFTCPGYGSPLDVARALRDSGIKFDQLIREYGWVHISRDPRARQELWTKVSAEAHMEPGIIA